MAGNEKGVLLGFAFSAWLATSPDSLAAWATWKWANVSGQVASHTSVRPFFQGITEIPSGLLPSERAIPVGSRREGIFAKASDLLRRSFTAACLGRRPRLLLQLRPCKPTWFQFSINCAGYDDSCFSNTYIVGCGVHTCPVEAI